MKKIAITAIFLFIVSATNVFAQTTADEWVEKGREYVNKEDYTNAISAYSEAIKLDGTNFNAYWGRGDWYLNTGNYNAAIADYSKVITDMPYIATKNYDADIDDFNKAFSLNSVGKRGRARRAFQ